MIQRNEKTCPRCGAAKLKEWADLDDEQKFTVERLPLSAEYSRKERSKHRFCTRCWFEQTERKDKRT